MQGDLVLSLDRCAIDDGGGYGRQARKT